MCKAPRLAIGIVVAAVSLMGVHGATDSEAQLTQLTVDGDDLDSPLIPSAEQVAAAQEAWARRILQADETGREAQLHARLRAAKRLPSTRRGLQSGGDDMWAGMWKYESAILSGSMAGSIGGSSTLGADDRILSSPTESDGDAAATAALLGAHPDGNVCDDSLAENVGTAGPCSYDCEVLQQRFFPESTRTTRCFLYTETGWRADGEPMGEELMDMRNDRLDWHTFLEPTPASSEAITFTVGELGCVNVTIQTSIMPSGLTGSGSSGSNHTETRCIPPGIHEHNHTVTDPHSVEVVGYTSSGPHEGAGGTTEFVVGECTDTLIRINTESSSEVSWTLRLDEDDHNGPWSFASSGMHEHVSCMFDNRYTLTMDGGAGWIGTVEVVSWVPDKTIHIPPDEDWIIQGSESDGVPATLDARLKSGTAYPRESMTISFASLIVRHVRFTSQQATLDPHEQDRTHSLTRSARLGGALEYTGGWGATLYFEHCVFDHLFATSGGAMFIDGQMDEFANLPENRGVVNEALTLVISSCLFWELQAPWVGGGMRIVDVFPLDMTIIDTQFIDNYATISSGFNWALYSNSFDDGTGVLGRSYANITRIELTQEHTFKPAGPFGGSQYEQGPLWLCSFPGHWNTKDDHPEVGTDVHIERLLCHDMEMVRHACSAVVSGSNVAGYWNTTMIDSEFRNAFGTQTSSVWAAGAYLYWSDAIEIARTRFDNVGVKDPTKTAIAEGVMFFVIGDVARLVNVEVTNSVAAKGTAAAFTGPGRAEVIRCHFHGNIAWQAGGALYHKAAGALFVQGSTFLNNVVERDHDEDAIAIPSQIVVTVYTGALGRDGTSTAAAPTGMSYLPVWKLGGAEPSEDDGSCGERNCTLGGETIYGGAEYTKNSYFATVVTTTPGTHRLWHGVITNIPDPATDWKGGWIAIRDTLDKTSPSVFDNRVRACPTPCPQGHRSNGHVRQEDCYTGTRAGADETAYDFCRGGQAFWSYTDITVPYGRGGAIAAEGGAPVEIRDSTFSDNLAGYGKELAIVGSDQFTVSNTSFLPDVTVGEASSNTIYTDAVVQSTCERSHPSEQAPCGLGTRCTFSRLSLFCVPCQRNEIGDGLTCTACPPGTSPNPGQTECVLCPNGYRSSLGFCEACATGKVSSSDRMTCVDCLPGTATGVCEDCITCQDCAEVGPNTFSSGQQIECTACPAGEQPNEEHTACEDCPAGRTGTDGSCAQCEAGTRPNEARSSCQRCFGVGEFSADGVACTVCPDGTEPNTDVTGCTPCPVRTAGRLGVCIQCAAGTQPRSDKAECEECAEGTFSTGSAEQGLCAACEPGKTPNDAKTACESCGLTSVSVDGACAECMGRQVPNTDRSACVCKPGTYSQRQLGLVQCRGDYRSVDLEDECIECASCLNCVELGVVQSTSGWAVYGAPGQLYECPVDEACLPKTFYNVSSTLETTCAEGYTGPVCGDCEDGYNHLKVGQKCDSCIGNVINIPLLLGLFFTVLAVGGAVISGMTNALRDHGIITDFRIIIGFYQVLAQMDNVLSMALPTPIPELVGFIKLFFLDLRAIIRADCWDAGGLYYKLAINMFVIPFLFFFGCFLVYIQQKKTATVIIAAGGADQSAFTTVRAKFKQNVFVGIFLLYPTMTSTLFRFPQCRSFGEDSFHEEDYSVDCSSSTFSFMGFITIILIVLVPVGVPLGFLWAMKSKKTALGGVNTNDLGGGKLNEADADDDDDDYSFLIKDYRPEFWYYEIVTYARKLLLGGLSVIMARGTMAQVYFVAALEAFFLCYHFRTYPFVQYKHNLMDGLGHLCLILTYVSCIVLRQTDQGVWSEEVISRAGYGYFICFLYVIVLPSPTLYYYFADSKKLKEIDNDTDTENFATFSNPVIPVGAPLGGGAFEPESEPADVPRARMAKIQREAAEAKSQTDTLRATVHQQAEEIEQLKTAGAQQVQLTAEERLAAEHRAAEQRAAEQAATAAELEAQHTKSIGADGTFNVRRFSQVTAMREMVEGGLLSDEILQSAQQSLEIHVHDGVLLQRKQMVRRQREIEQREIDEGMKGLEKVSKTAHKGRTSMRDFLDKARLLRHEGQFLEVCGHDMAVEDLEFLGDEELKVLKGRMTSVEGKRFEKALRQAQEGAVEA